MQNLTKKQPFYNGLQRFTHSKVLNSRTGLTGDEIDIVLKEDNLSIKDFEVIVPENKSKILKKTSK